ncbi:EamA family transporter [Roseomonas eburnea]|uniref:EamA family transporter n=1 Tax=Neoroseomonas eburnea TaxID=1346889 RepID=A0A9X9XE46_9PROT|nr:EamA family transporter [Neoroseomonas eburnea]MBR0681982.1 EamA family transporter [Neoroseomonas eburnea]
MPTTSTALGIAAGLTAAATWGGALAMTRLGVAGPSSLGPADIAMLRFLGPAILLLPVLLRAMPRLRNTGALLLATLLLGGGAPFVLVAGSGLRIAGAAEAGALLPGTMPLCVAAMSVALGERIHAARRAGLALLAAAAAAVAGPSLAEGEDGESAGHLLLLAAAALSAAYTVALRRSGLGAWEAAAFVSAGSVLCLGPVHVLAMEPCLERASWGDIAAQAAFQGLGPGLLAPVAFAMAVARLGASRAAAFGSLSPAAATLAGMGLLGEVPDATTFVAVLASGVGVVLATRAPAGQGIQTGR